MNTQVGGDVGGWVNGWVVGRAQTAFNVQGVGVSSEALFIFTQHCVMIPAQSCYSLCCYSLCCYSLCCYSLCCYSLCCYSLPASSPRQAAIPQVESEQPSFATPLIPGRGEHVLSMSVCLQPLYLSPPHPPSSLSLAPIGSSTHHSDLSFG